MKKVSMLSIHLIIVCIDVHGALLRSAALRLGRSLQAHRQITSPTLTRMSSRRLNTMPFRSSPICARSIRTDMSHVMNRSIDVSAGYRPWLGSLWRSNLSNQRDVHTNQPSFADSIAKQEAERIVEALEESPSAASRHIAQQDAQEAVLGSLYLLEHAVENQLYRDYFKKRLIAARNWAILESDVSASAPLKDAASDVYYKLVNYEEKMRVFDEAAVHADGNISKIPILKIKLFKQAADDYRQALDIFKQLMEQDGRTVAFFDRLSIDS